MGGTPLRRRELPHLREGGRERRKQQEGGDGTGEGAVGQGERATQSRLPGSSEHLSPTLRPLPCQPSRESPLLSLPNDQPTSSWQGRGLESRSEKEGTQFRLGTDDTEPNLHFRTKTQTARQTF